MIRDNFIPTNSLMGGLMVCIYPFVNLPSEQIESFEIIINFVTTNNIQNPIQVLRDLATIM